MRATEIDTDTRRAAGCLIYAKETREWLLIQRSAYVDSPMTWAIPGGSALPQEDYLDAAIRETIEETGHNLSSAPSKLIYSHETDWPRTIYKTYAVVVDKPFKPVLDWESVDHRWCTLDDMPTPLHPGIEAMIRHDQSAEILHEWLTNLTTS